MSAVYAVDLRQGIESDHVLAGVKNTADGIIGRVHHFFADDAMHLLIGVVVGLVVLVLIRMGMRR